VLSARWQRWSPRLATHPCRSDLRVHDGLFTLYVVELDVAGPAEGDDLLHSFGHGTLCSPEARWFWMELVGFKGLELNNAVI
jgi:hypothetical protein